MRSPRDNPIQRMSGCAASIIPLARPLRIELLDPARDCSAIKRSRQSLNEPNSYSSSNATIQPTIGRIERVSSNTVQPGNYCSRFASGNSQDAAGSMPRRPRRYGRRKRASSLAGRDAESLRLNCVSIFLSTAGTRVESAVNIELPFSGAPFRLSIERQWHG